MQLIKTPTKGMNDYLPRETRLREYVKGVIIRAYEKNGFSRTLHPSANIIFFALKFPYSIPPLKNFNAPYSNLEKNKTPLSRKYFLKASIKTRVSTHAECSISKDPNESFSEGNAPPGKLPPIYGT